MTASVLPSVLPGRQGEGSTQLLWQEAMAAPSGIAAQQVCEPARW